MSVAGVRHLPDAVGESRAVPVASEGKIIFGLALVVYLAAASALVFGHNIIEGDAYSRVGNAYYVLYSRDPHLAAIGFVWNPLPSLAMLPLLPLKQLWPAIVSAGFVANIVSAVFMAGAVYQLSRALREMGLRWPLRLVFTGLFALHPLVLYHGANGLSEAPTLFFFIFSVRYLARWLRHGEMPDLVLAGTGLGFGYFARYETLPAGMTALLCVAVVSFLRCQGDRHQRTVSALYDLTICGSPLALSFVIWTMASWIIVGHPFEQFQSVYGNSSQARYFGAPRPVVTADVGILTPLLASWLGQALVRVLLLEPPLPVVLPLLLPVVWLRRDTAVLAPASVLGGALLFTVGTTATNTIGPANRYYIWAMPLAVLLAAQVVAWNGSRGGRAADKTEDRRAGSTHPRTATSRDGGARRVLLWATPVRSPAPAPASRTRWSIGAGQRDVPTMVARALVALVVLAGLAGSFPSATWLMLNPRLSFEAAGLRKLYDPPAVAQYYATAREAAQDLDSLHLGTGKVLLDTFTGFPVVLSSNNPQQFVITSDRDFPVRLADPVGTAVAYLLVPPDEPLDALNRRYPSLYQTGAGIADFVKEFRAAGDPGVWRLYRVRSTLEQVQRR